VCSGHVRVDRSNRAESSADRPPESVAPPHRRRRRLDAWLGARTAPLRPPSRRGVHMVQWRWPRPADRVLGRTRPPNEKDPRFQRFRWPGGPSTCCGWSRIRTWEGYADGFTESYQTGSDLRLDHRSPARVRVSSVSRTAGLCPLLPRPPRTGRSARRGVGGKGGAAIAERRRRRPCGRRRGVDTSPAEGDHRDRNSTDEAWHATLAT